MASSMDFVSMIFLKIRLAESDREGRGKTKISWESVRAIRSLVQRWRPYSSTSVSLEFVCNPPLTRFLPRFPPVSLRVLSEVTRRVSSPRVTTLTLRSARHWKVCPPPSRDQHFVFHSSSIDFRTQLSTTDYGNFLANEPSPVSTSTIAEKATQVLVDQFNYLRTNAVEPLSKFFDYITYVPARPSAATLC